MTVKEIVVSYLKEHGYDGLCTIECGCFLQDIAPCSGACWDDCNPGYKHLDDDGDWYITPEKPEEARP